MCDCAVYIRWEESDRVSPASEYKTWGLGRRGLYRFYRPQMLNGHGAVTMKSSLCFVDVYDRMYVTYM